MMTGDAEPECVKDKGHDKSTIWLYSPSPGLEEEMKKHPIEHGPEELKLCMARLGWEATTGECEDRNFRLKEVDARLSKDESDDHNTNHQKGELERQQSKNCYKKRIMTRKNKREEEC